MKFINLSSLCEGGSLPDACVLCLGNFDGVHLGHRQLVKTALDYKHSHPSVLCGAWLFADLSYKSAPSIYSVEQKLYELAQLGLNCAFIADFNEVKDLSPADFVNGILKAQCHCVHAVCGENFRFGKGASASADMLLSLMNGHASVVPLFKIAENTVSSTAVRAFLQEGDTISASSYLGRDYSVSLPVIHGKELGRSLGFPTINQDAPEGFLLKKGVYATVCEIDGLEYAGVTNVGVRPTVDSFAHENIETHVIGFSGDCYGKTVKISFVERIRDEMRFDSLDELIRQISDDARTAAAIIKEKKR